MSYLFYQRNWHNRHLLPVLLLTWVVLHAPLQVSSHPMTPIIGHDFTSEVQNATSSALSSAQTTLSAYSSILFAVSLPISLIATFFGYRLIRPLFFVAGASMGGLVFGLMTYVLLIIVTGHLHGHIDNHTAAHIAIYLAILVSIVAAVSLGYLAFIAVDVGVFCVGVTAGLAAGYLVVSVAGFHQPYDIHKRFIYYISVAIAAVLLGVAGLYVRYKLLVMTTSGAGAAGFLLAIAHFKGYIPSSQEGLVLKSKEDWIFLVAFLLMSGIGMIVQFKYTAPNALQLPRGVLLDPPRFEVPYTAVANKNLHERSNPY